MMTLSYKTHDPIGWCGNANRGAALGRGSYHAEDKNLPIKFILRQIRIDSGGYDSNGTYFGIGNPIYWCANEEYEVDFVLRAYNREQAKAEVREQYPNARFYN